MYFMLDNYDSFVYNLSASFKELGQDILVKREHEITLSEIKALRPEGIILSPGPGKPSDAAMYYFGACVKKGKRPMHGKLTDIAHEGKGLFSGLPRTFRVTRYHSLVVSPEGLPKELNMDAWTGEGVIMGISHRSLPVYGVQFHPEAVLTEYGLELLNNFRKICRDWRNTYENYTNA